MQSLMQIGKAAVEYNKKLSIAGIEFFTEAAPHAAALVEEFAEAFVNSEIPAAVVAMEKATQEAAIPMVLAISGASARVDSAVSKMKAAMRKARGLPETEAEQDEDEGEEFAAEAATLHRI